MTQKSECYKSNGIELRLGRWQDVLDDVVQCDALITDPPYSERTHNGQRTGSSIRKSTIKYKQLTNNEYIEISKHWSKVTKNWSILFGDHYSYNMHEKSWLHNGWYTFSPVIWIKNNAPPRFSGDGPACQCEFILVARPKTFVQVSGSRPGFYITNTVATGKPGAKHPGFKHINLMRALIRDYTLKDDLIVDPYAGSGTTLLAALIECRRCIGAECDPNTFKLAVERLKAGYTGELFNDTIKSRQYTSL
jgi:site-specific DNA-methyltransferase (adenine-specific)